MPNLGGWEWVIILVIVLLVFGVGRIGRLGEELGKGVRAFREGVREEGEEEPAEDATENEAED
ncbi:MAG: twin-arginine translocase TatA/TatE family subunit [Chloroflexota bacterium]|jgi:sec-independent protein translocase protein TatA